MTLRDIWERDGFLALVMSGSETNEICLTVCAVKEFVGVSCSTYYGVYCNQVTYSMRGR